jgi:hypothetical protein
VATERKIMPQRILSIILPVVMIVSWKEMRNYLFTKMKIHAHPGLFPTPCIWATAAASKPENAPTKEADEKKIEILLSMLCMHSK